LTTTTASSAAEAFDGDVQCSNGRKHLHRLKTGKDISDAGWKCDFNSLTGCV